jgi:pyruvate formate lyase activating enzyme
LIIGGFQKFSLIEYPDKICAIVFTQGCNFRCPYCHNPELISLNPPEVLPNNINEQEILSFLDHRREKLDAVELTGGEPTLQPDLIEFLKKIKALGYLIKLDSNGSHPEVIENAIKLKLVDYLAMDVKAPLEKYQVVTKSNIDTMKIKKSIDIIMNSGIDYEFRTTVVKSQLSKEDIIEIKNLIKGAKLYVLQKFTPSKSLNPEFLTESTYSDEEFESLKNLLKNYVVRCTVR